VQKIVETEVELMGARFPITTTRLSCIYVPTPAAVWST